MVFCIQYLSCECASYIMYNGIFVHNVMYVPLESADSTLSILSTLSIEDPGMEPLRHRKQRFFLNRAPEGLVREFRNSKSFWWLPPGPKWAHRTLSILSTLASNGLIAPLALGI